MDVEAVDIAAYTCIAGDTKIRSDVGDSPASVDRRYALRPVSHWAYDLARHIRESAPNKSPQSVSRWTAEERHALRAFLLFEVEFDTFRSSASRLYSLGNQVCRSVMENYRRYEGAVPFGPPERHWLVEQWSRAGHPNDPAALQGSRGSVVEKGIEIDVSGGELLRRWVDWRHTPDGSPEGDIREQAAAALADIVLIADGLWP